MADQLLYTSAADGLNLGSSGYCTVEQTSGLTRGIVSTLQSLSSYDSLYQPTPHPDNPVVFSHVIVTAGRRTYNVLSRISDYQPDYSGRSNFLAHHVVPTAEEVARLFNGPAALLEHPDVMKSEWSGLAQFVEELAPPATGRAQGICKAWQAAGVDPGWAGALCQQSLDDPRRPTYVIVPARWASPPAGIPAEKITLTLIAEALALVPPDRRWQMTFSTYYGEYLSATSCQWRFVIAGTQGETAARSVRNSLLIDLTAPLGDPPPGDLVTLAQKGQATISAPPAPAAEPVAGVVATATPVVSVPEPSLPPVHPTDSGGPPQLASADAVAVPPPHGGPGEPPPPNTTNGPPALATGGPPPVHLSKNELTRLKAERDSRGLPTVGGPMTGQPKSRLGLVIALTLVGLTVFGGGIGYVAFQFGGLWGNNGSSGETTGTKPDPPDSQIGGGVIEVPSDNSEGTTAAEPGAVVTSLPSTANSQSSSNRHLPAHQTDVRPDDTRLKERTRDDLHADLPELQKINDKKHHEFLWDTKNSTSKLSYADLKKITLLGPSWTSSFEESSGNYSFKLFVPSDTAKATPALEMFCTNVGDQKDRLLIRVMNMSMATRDLNSLRWHVLKIVRETSTERITSYVRLTSKVAKFTAILPRPGAPLRILKPKLSIPLPPDWKNPHKLVYQLDHLAKADGNNVYSIVGRREEKIRLVEDTKTRSHVGRLRIAGPDQIGVLKFEYDYRSAVQVTINKMDADLLRELYHMIKWPTKLSKGYDSRLTLLFRGTSPIQKPDYLAVLKTYRGLIFKDVHSVKITKGKKNDQRKMGLNVNLTPIEELKNKTDKYVNGLKNRNNRRLDLKLRPEVGANEYALCVKKVASNIDALLGIESRNDHVPFRGLRVLGTVFYRLTVEGKNIDFPILRLEL